MLLAAAVLLLQSSATDSATLRHADGRVPPTVTAVRVQRPPDIDGRLDDPAWAEAPAVMELLQVDPDEGRPASESTAVRVVYDDAALYVGARLYDSEPGRVDRRLGRRDAFSFSDQSDLFRVLLDSYHDHRTAFRFEVNPAGVKGDVLFGNDGEFADQSWDPVWEVATAIDSLGWTVEMRIPFSQLRFSRAPEQVWGVRFVRTILRKNEFALFPFVGKTESGFVSRFAHLIGLRDIPAPRRLEILPYSVARGTYHEPQVAGNPFDQRSAYFGGAGLDLKYGVTSNLTLDATVNPDFGQVEADPAFVNLTAFEQFLEERRPFFVEGANIFQFGGTGPFIGFGGTPRFFYSRRIGRSPEGSAQVPAVGYASIPDNTTILSAGKLSGKTAGGWSIGVLDALTAAEQATIDSAGVRSREEVEPFSNYFVGRLKREVGGHTGIGLLATAVNRHLDAPQLDFLRTAAYVGAADFFHRWKSSAYSLTASVGASYVTGDTTAIQAAQTSSARYYQRPDAGYLQFNPRRTALAGLTADFAVSKEGGSTNWALGASTSTPGFEVNDLGFQTRVDRISAAGFLGHRWTKPGKVFRQATVSVFAGPSWNYGRDLIQMGLSASHFAQFRNFWGYVVFGGWNASAVDDRLTRGGPLASTPWSWNLGSDVFSDQRRWVGGEMFAFYNGSPAGGRTLNLNPSLALRPSSAVAVQFGPRYSTGRTAAQFLEPESDSTAVATYGARYVFGELVQHQLDLTLRVNLTFSPTLSFQLYAQPFTFAGDYRAFEELRGPRTFDFTVYGRDNGSTIRYDAPTQTYTVHPDGTQPNDSLQFANPDFRVRSLRSNAVLRWEYRPGSTIFVVWTQSRSGTLTDPTFDAGHYVSSEILRDRPTNVLLVKVNYWLSL